MQNADSSRAVTSTHFPAVHAVCANCGYNLSGLPIGSDQRQCPECGRQSPAAAEGPLTQGQLDELAAAKVAAKRIRRTAGVARMSAWTTGVFAGCTLLGILFGSVTSFLLGGALMVVAVREGRFGSRLAAFEAEAPKGLAVNQLILGGVIIAYALWQIVSILHAKTLPGLPQSSGDAQVDGMLGDIAESIRPWVVAFYGCVGLAGALGTGLMALYYSRRGPMVRAFLAKHPKWIVDTMRAAG